MLNSGIQLLIHALTFKDEQLHSPIIQRRLTVWLHLRCLNLYMVSTHRAWMTCLLLKVCHTSYVTRVWRSSTVVEPQHLAYGLFLTLELNFGTIYQMILRKLQIFQILSKSWKQGADRIWTAHSDLMYESLSHMFTNHFNDPYIESRSMSIFLHCIPVTWADRTLSFRLDTNREYRGTLSPGLLISYLFIALYMYCTCSRILATTANVHCLPYDFK